MSFLLRTRCNPALFKHALRGNIRAFSTGTMVSSDKVYEMRTYTLKPERFIDYMRLTYDKFGLRTQHSKLCGFWSMEIGGTLSEVTHIWEYDSYTHRAAVRKALSQDDTWLKEYVQHFMEMAVRQENMTMKAVPWYPVQKSKSTGGIYMLHSKTIKPGKLDQLAHRWQMGLDAYCKHDSPVGVWVSEMGPKNRMFALQSYENIDEYFRIREAMMQDEEIRELVRDCAEFLVDEDFKILTPAQFSPWK